jgi:hypothetical protein
VFSNSPARSIAGFDFVESSSRWALAHERLSDEVGGDEVGGFENTV